MKYLQSIKILAIGLSCCMIPLLNNNITFAIDLVAYDFKVALPDETFSGKFIVDLDLILGVGQEEISAAEGLLVNFNYRGTNYRQSDDESFDAFPKVTFFNGDLLGLSFAPAFPSFQLGDSLTFFSEGGKDFNDELGFDSIFNNVVTYTRRDSLSIPEPDLSLTLGLLGIGCLIKNFTRD